MNRSLSLGRRSSASNVHFCARFVQIVGGHSERIKGVVFVGVHSGCINVAFFRDILRLLSY